MSIRQKMVLGYALSLGIALGGTWVGLLVGRHYQQQAFQSRQAASRDYALLSNLQLDILYNRPAKQLSPYLDDPEEFRQASDSLIQRIDSIAAQLQAHNTTRNHSPGIEDLQGLLNQYEHTVNQFAQAAQAFVDQVEEIRGQPNFQARSEALLVELVQSPEFGEFIEFPNQLEPFYQLARRREETAEVALAQAERLQMQIILMSSVGAIAIAIAIALYTSRLIAKPIQTLTQVAQQVTQDSNFHLQAPVQTQDEVGLLAQSFNQLIQQVQQLVAELETKNQDLCDTLKTLHAQQARTIQTEKMSSLGQLVAGVAHEINNPVNFIHGNLSPMQEHIQDLLNLLRLYQQHYPRPHADIQMEIDAIELDFLQADLIKILDSMAIGTKRIRRIVLSLRNFSRMDEAEFKTVDIHEGIESTLLILQHRLHAKFNRPAIEVECDFAQLPVIDCYPGQLNQVFMNLLVNSIDAIEEYQGQALSTATDTPQPGHITIRTTRLGEDWVEIAIADNGPGIPETLQQKIFEPFFTTKAVGKGTGMGMSISYQIITEKHGGSLECQSQPGQGAEFTIRLPIRQRVPLGVG